MVLAIGLMSGTSCDAVDAALVELEGSGTGTRVKLLHYTESRIPTALREKLLLLGSGGQTTAGEITRISNELGEVFARAAASLVDGAGKQLDDIAFVGSHGQTVYHDPGAHATLQIGSPAIIAQRTGCLTVGDFRSADVALGGQGAPLVPYVDLILHGSKEEPRLLLNIGGIANITVLPAGATAGDVVAFDTGPGNMLMDIAAQHFTQGRQHCDKDGEMAARGGADDAMLEWLLQAASSFLCKDPPKSTGRDEFGRGMFDRLLTAFPAAETSTVLATLNAFTAHAICAAATPFIERHAIKEVWVAGGGAHNPILMRNLQQRLGDTCRLVVQTGNAFDTNAREAIAFAVLANETLHGRCSNLPTVTGASRPAVLGAVHMGRRRSSKLQLHGL